MESYDEKDVERIKRKIKEELVSEGVNEVDDEFLTSMARHELIYVEHAKEDQKYLGWTVYFYRRKIIGMGRISLIKKLKQRLPNWGDFEEKNDRIDLTDPTYGYDVRIDFGSFISPSNTNYHAKITSSILAWKRYRNKEHRKVLFTLWDQLFSIPAEAYLDFEGYSKMINRR
jgi:hypothetical protein